MARPRSLSDEDLLAAAVRVIAAHGLAGLTFARVAAEAGVAAGTLAHRFGSKRALLLAVARSGAGAVPAAFARARARAPEPEEAVAEALASLVAGIGDPREVANHVGFLELDLRDPEFRAVAATHARAVRAEIAALVGDDALARRVKAVYDGTLIGWALEPDGTLAAAVRDAVRATLAAPGPTARIPR